MPKESLNINCLDNSMLEVNYYHYDDIKAYANTFNLEALENPVSPGLMKALYPHAEFSNGTVNSDSTEFANITGSEVSIVAGTKTLDNTNPSSAVIPGQEGSIGITSDKITIDNPADLWDLPDSPEVNEARIAMSNAVPDDLVGVHYKVYQYSDTGPTLIDIDLKDVDFSQAPIDIVPEPVVRKHQAIPLFQQGRTLYVALADPTNLAAIDELRFLTGLQVEAMLVEQDKLERAIETHFSALDSAVAGLDDIAVDDGTAAADALGMDVSATDANDAPVVRFVNKVLLDAINRGASDIHFEPYENAYRVRLRQDGVLREVAHPPPAIGMRLAARIKVMARLDLAERRIPQDGRIKLKAGRNRAVDFRVSTCPTLHGEKIVMRILDPSTARLGIESLGYDARQREIFETTVHKPYGMVLVTGPTGSGKTVSLYTALNILNTSDRNISTAEDPAEINLPGINQVNVHPKVGLTFASCPRESHGFM